MFQKSRLAGGQAGEDQRSELREKVRIFVTETQRPERKVAGTCGDLAWLLDARREQGKYLS